MRDFLAITVIGTWLVAIGAGLQLLWAYQSTPGRPATPPATWPSGSSLAREEGLPTLVVLAHPHCPCTRATLDELNVLANQVHALVTTDIVFSIPTGTEPGWERSDSWARAHEIPGAHVVRDDGEVETARFAAWTSGQALLYDASGTLVFSGGLTAFRGHAGDSVGREALLAWIRDGHAERRSTSVFGCSLVDAHTSSWSW